MDENLINNQQDEVQHELIQHEEVQPELVDHAQLGAQPLILEPGLAGEQIKRQELEQNENELNKYNIQFDRIPARMKRYSTKRGKGALKTESSAIRQRILLGEDEYIGSKKEMLDQASLLQNESELLLRDKKWYRLFKFQSAEMDRVKESVSYLNNLLDRQLPLVNMNNRTMLDTKYLTDTIIPAYQAAFDACHAYIALRKRTGAKHSTGIRRLEKVKRLQSMLQNEKENFSIIVDNAKANRFRDVDWSKIGKEGKPITLRDVIGEIRTNIAVISYFVPEGNSSNVYRVRVRDDKTGKYYYVKINEKLLHEDVGGYLERRIQELNRSKGIKENGDLLRPTEEDVKNILKQMENKEISEEEGDRQIIENRSKREELRLEGKIDLEDYNFALNFLNTMKSKLDALPDAARRDKEAKYAAFLAHDFDKMFRDLAEYNAEIVKINGDVALLENLIHKLESENANGKYNVQLDSLRHAKQNGIRPMTELDWLKAVIKNDPEKYGINEQADAELFAILDEMGNREYGENNEKIGLSRFFTRSLGKEVELFGQHAERSGLSSSDVLASNNTATSRLADMFNFSDVVTTSFKGRLKLTEVGMTTQKSHLVTFSEEAPGKELLQIMQDAQKYQQEHDIKESLVQFTPEAIRQMSRLHTFDLITLQTDRHWRNIKADFEEVQGNPKRWIIKSIKSYDHDQSCGNKNLKQYFPVVADPATGKKSTQMPGFLKPIMMTVNRNSKLYRYTQATKMTSQANPMAIAGNANFLDAIELPKAKTKDIDDYFKQFKQEHGTDFYAAYPFMPELFIPRAFDITTPMTKHDFSFRSYSKVMKANQGKEALVKKFYLAMNKLIAPFMEDRQSSWNDFYNKADDMTANQKNAAAQEQQNALNAKIDSERRMYADSQNFPVTDELVADCKNLVGEVMTTKYAGRKEHLKAFREAYALYQQLDFTKLEEDGMESDPMVTGRKDIKGYYDFMLQSFFYNTKMYFASGEKNETARDELLQEDLEHRKNELKEEKFAELQLKYPNMSLQELENRAKDEADKEAEKEMSEDVRVPAVLHMDRAAYNSVCDALENDEILEYMLCDLGMSQDKKDALRQRLQQIKDEALEAEKVVKKWAKLKGLPEDSIEAKFFLEPEEFAQINKLTDMVLDPGLSYFSNEDSQFMIAQPEMKNYFNEEDKARARAITNHERNEPRQKAGDLVGEYTSMVNNQIVHAPAA